MGLGKTLTIISFTVAVLASPILDNIKFDPTPATSKSSKSDKKPKDTNKNELGSYFSPLKADENAESPPRNYFFTVLIIAPVNTLSNWVNEFNKWCPEVIYRTKRDSYINVSLLAAEDNGMDPHKKLELRVKKLKKWHTEGGVLIMGYDMFRLLTTEKGESENKKNAANPKLFADIKRYLIDPGPDIVICDEAHTIKEKKSKITELLCKIVTKRRIALTGSPLQNNLEEYYQMVNWVKPRFLGTLSYFKRTYAQIIAAGENKGAGHSELIAMRKRAYMLHKKLKPIVDRKDLTELEKTLLPKREFSVLIKMSEFQGFMYKTFLARLIEANRGDNSKLIFTAFQALLRVWNHPSIAVINAIQKSNKLAKSNSVSKQTISMKLLEREMEPQVDFFENEGQELSQKLSEDILQIEVNLAQQESSLKSGNDFVDLVDVSDEENDYNEEYDDDYNDVALETQIDDGAEYDEEDESKSPNLQNNLNNVSGDSETHPMDTSKEDDSSIKEVRICDENWWKLKERTTDTPSFEHGEFIKLSNKLVIFLSLLASSINSGDKVLVFTQSVMTLELIECVLKSERWGDVINIPSECSTCKFSQWKEKYHYLRIDGSTSDRQDSIDKFNKLSHIKLFMLSTKAGNMGINLQSANRVVIFDSSWNPAHDLQAIYRAYRYGQTKNVFVYRLLAAGTMEEKIYKKQINKQAMSARIIDAQMPDNHFTMEEKAELLKFTEYKSADFAKVKEALTREPQDHVLMKILESYQSCLHSVDDQTALLEDKDELKLNDQELKEADAELELEERNLGREGREEREVVPEQQQQQSTPIVTGDTRIEVPSTVNNDDNTPSSSADSLSDTVKKIISSLSPQDQVLFYQYRRQGISLPEAFDKIRNQGSQK
jgi:transcriptional regulator ATRX